MRPYCLLLAMRSFFQADLLRPNNSFKPDPLRGFVLNSPQTVPPPFSDCYGSGPA